MSIILKEETNNSSLVAALQTPLPPVPNKNPLIPPPPVIPPVPTIVDAAVVTLSDAFLDLSTKFQLSSILNRK